MLVLDTTSKEAIEIRDSLNKPSQFVGLIPSQVVDKQENGRIGGIIVLNASIDHDTVKPEDVVETVFVLVQDGDQVAITRDQAKALVEAISQIS